VFAIPSMILTSSVVASVSAQSAASPLFTEQIKVTREMSVPIDQVWNIVSNVDEETKYWSIIKDIKNINMTDNMVDREVTIGVGPQDTKTRQFVTLSLDQKLIQTNITEGPVTGSRVLTLNSISDSNATRVDVVWDLDLNNIPVFARGFTKDNFMKTTEEALDKIAQTGK
jgi:ribosome-associated toxin RatA of RatAB toxin-antitoxin module